MGHRHGDKDGHLAGAKRRFSEIMRRGVGEGGGNEPDDIITHC